MRLAYPRMHLPSTFSSTEKFDHRNNNQHKNITNNKLFSFKKIIIRGKETKFKSRNTNSMLSFAL
jgi:hypothetical protein